MLIPPAAPLASRRTRAVRRLVPLFAVALAPLAGCSGAGATSGSKDSRELPPHLPPPSAAQLIEWALGSDSRGPYPATGDGFLLLELGEPTPQDAQAPAGGAVPPTNAPPENSKSVTPECARISSILPGPFGELFLLLDGVLHMLRTSQAPAQSSAAAPAPVQGPARLSGDAPVPFSRLLGFHAEGSSIRILASASRKDTGEMQVWSLTLSGSGQGGVHAEPLAEKDMPRTREAFFETYQSPRCQRDGGQCLQLSDNGREHFIDVKPKQGLPTKLRPLGTAGALDVAWKPGGGLYVVMGCPR